MTLLPVEMSRWTDELAYESSSHIWRMVRSYWEVFVEKVCAVVIYGGPGLDACRDVIGS